MNDALQRGSILIVDDAPENIRMLSELLRGEYSVRVATSGGKAIQIARSGTPPDLILLDVIMPDPDGYETCKRLKADERSRNIPVIFVTAIGVEESESYGFELGAVDYITKPFNPVIVQARVRTHLTLRRYSLELESQKAALSARIYELELAKDHIKTLQDFIPICSYCKRIRDDQNYWNQLEGYLQAHSEIQFSHGICPDCLEQHFPEIAQKRREKLPVETA